SSMKITYAGSCGITSTIITTLARISHWRGTRRHRVKSSLRRKAGSSQSLKSAGCIMITDELHNVGDPVSSGMLIKSMGGLSARAEISVHCCRATCRRPEFESSIRRRDRHLIIREWALHSQDGIFGTDRILTRHSLDQLTNFLVDLGASNPTCSGFPFQKELEALSVPFNNCIGFDDDQDFPPISPELR